MNNKADTVIVVMGATGQQGGAVVRHLLKQGWHVRAVTRDPHKPAAQALAQAGAEVVYGDAEDISSLETVINEAYGVFSVQGFWENGIDSEIQQGKHVAKVAKAAGVKHFVYTSVGGAERGTGVPHFESKWQIEQHIRDLALPFTILRPVEFMENFYWSRDSIFGGTMMSQGLRPQRLKQLIAVDDIGAFAAIVFENPQAYLGRAFEVAGDALTEQQIVETFSRVLDRPVKLIPRPDDVEHTTPQELLKMWAWFDKEGYNANITALRTVHPSLQTLETWIRSTGWDITNP